MRKIALCAALVGVSVSILPVSEAASAAPPPREPVLVADVNTYDESSNPSGDVRMGDQILFNATSAAEGSDTSSTSLRRLTPADRMMLPGSQLTPR